MKKKLVVINLVGLSCLRKLRLQLGFSVQYLANKNVQKRWLRKICWTRKKNLHMMMQLQNWQRVLSNFAPIFFNWSCLALARKRPAHIAGIRKLVYTQHTHTHASHHCYEPVRLPAKQYNRPILSLYSKYWDWNLTYTHRLPHFPHPLHPPQTHFWRGHMLYTASL